jgi:hypothetical protein
MPTRTPDNIIQKLREHDNFRPTKTKIGAKMKNIFAIFVMKL